MTENSGIYHYQLLVTEIAIEKGFKTANEFMDFLESCGPL